MQPQMATEKTKPTINISGRLTSLERPLIMGILNLTPDSFYKASRCEAKEQIAARARAIVEQGGDIIDAGAYSSRPGAGFVSEKEETERLCRGLEIIRETYPDIPVSVDTFRAGVADRAIKEFGAAMVNDISGGTDPHMFETVAANKVPYVLMHMRGTPETMQELAGYRHITAEIIKYFSRKTALLHQLGVNDIILDPGFGFAKDLDDNYRLLRDLPEFAPFGMPLLVGISRKSMIYRLLGTTPEESLNGTTALNMLALTKGADILRVHDVKECAETIKLFLKTNGK